MKASSKVRKVYLVRHGEPALDADTSYCLGDSPVSLSSRGIRQAEQAGRWLKRQQVSRVYTGPYQRCIQTAECIAKACGIAEVQKWPELREIDAGRWNNRTFRDIRQKDEAAWKKRGENLGYEPIPDGESFDQAGKRFGEAVFRILRESGGNLAISAHAGVIRAFVCQLTGKDLNTLMDLPQPYGGITILHVENEDKGTDDPGVSAGIRQKPGASPHIFLQECGVKPECFLDRAEIRCLWEKYRTPASVIAHMEAVRDYLMQLLDLIDPAAVLYDRDHLERAALLHDMKRQEDRHAEVAGRVLLKEGYPEIAALAAQHHDGTIQTGEVLTPGDLLFYADKRICGTESVSLQMRFECSRVKCRSAEARASHQMQWMRARHIEERLNMQNERI